MKSSSTPACSLTHRLEQLHDEYATLLADVDRLASAAADGGTETSQLTAELQSLVIRVSRQEQLLAGIRQEWNAARRPHDAQLQVRMQDTAEQLERLLVRIADCERILRASREALRPQLDRLSRHREMQRAYGEHRRPAARGSDHFPS